MSGSGRNGALRPAASIDPHALQIFVAIAECGNMTLAGERLGLSQSAVSQALKHLERSLGVAVIDRDVRPCALTEAGQDFYERACRILAQINEAVHAARRSAHLGPTNLRVGLVDSYATRIGPSLARGLRDRGVGSQLLSGQSAMHAEALRRRELDLVVTSDDALVNEPAFTTQALMSEPVILALPADYSGRADQLDTIIHDLEMVRYSERAALGQQVNLHLRRLGLQPRSNLAFDSSEAVMAMVGAGLGFALTTPLCVFPAGRSLQHVQLAPFPGPELRRHLSIGHHSGELEEVAGDIASVSLAALRRDWLPEVTACCGWMGESIALGSDSA